MSGEGSLFDVPPAALGRFRVVHQIGAGTFGPVFRATDPESNTSVAVKRFTVRLTPTQAAAIARDLGDLVATLPRLSGLAVPLAAGLEDLTPYLATTLATGDSLDVALREFGPAALADLLPRVRTLAEALDGAAARGLVHGALHPRDVIVSERESTLTGIGIAPILRRHGVSTPSRRPYAAPEISEGDTGAASDQFALAALVFEWMTGRRLAGLGGVIDIPALPGIDREAMRLAFTRARSEAADDRFPSSVAFVDAVAAAVSLEESAAAPVSSQAPRRKSRAKSSPAGPAPLLAATEGDSDVTGEAAPAASDFEETGTAGDAGADDSMPPLALAEPVIADRLGEAPPLLTTADERTPIRASFGMSVVAVAAIAGTIVGLGLGYAVWGRAPAAPQVAAPSTAAEAPGRQGTEVAVDTAPPKDPAGAKPATPVPPQAGPVRPGAAGPAAPAAARGAAGSLLVRSNPAGATVFVDGERQGQTPVAVRSVELGTRRVRVQRDGFVTAERQVTLTADRPSRSLDVRLTAAPAARPAAAPPPRPQAPAAATGTLLVESRPVGASVLLNNRSVGVTPVTIDGLAPGEYTVHLELAGYLPFETTVRVVAGARARAAASLSQQEPE